MIESIAIRWTERLTQMSEEQHNAKLIAHSIASLLTNLSIIVFSLSAGLFLGTFKETFITLVMLIIIRKLSGGHHMPTLEACIVFTSFIAVTLPFVPGLPLPFHVICSSIFLLVILLGSHEFQLFRISSTNLWKLVILVLLCVVTCLGKFEIITGLFAIQTCFLIQRPLQQRR